MDNSSSDQNPNQNQAAQGEDNDVAMLEDAPMGSDHDAESQEGGVGPGAEGGEDNEDFVYVDDNEMAQLEAMADEEEAQAQAEGGMDNDFETYQESDFAEGDEYEDGHVL